MHFNIKILLLTLIVAGFFLYGCNRDGEGQPQSNPINSVEQLRQFIDGINFNVELADGSIIVFSTSSPEHGSLLSTNFISNGDGFTYTFDKQIGMSNSPNTSALLRIGEKEYNFNLVICTTFRDLASKYPQIEVHPDYLDYLIYFAVEYDNYTEQDLIFGDPIVAEYVMQLYVDPNDIYYYPLYGYLSNSIDVYYNLTGTHERSNNKVISEGVANYYSFNSQIFEGEYLLEMNCEN